MMTNPPPDDISDLAAALGLPIPEAYRAGVAEALVRLTEQAALVMAAPLPDTDDRASDFTW